MGAWGIKSFDNDTAADWVYDFEDGGAEFITSSLDAALDDGPAELDAPTCCEALAAAEIVAASKTGDTSRLSEGAADALLQHSDGIATAEHIARAKNAVARIKEKSELRELWEEVDEFEDWLKDLAGLEALLD